MTAFLPAIADDARVLIDARLAAIEQDHGVRILLAVESGSRAWGFPSPDSDYDVRFVYAHPTDWYLRIHPGRDVIERPIEGDLDINGWDLRKALSLLLKPNPVLLEWLSSPIRYRWHAPACARLEALARQTAHATACLHHYLHLGEGHWRHFAADRADINYKQYFYILRPALAIRWIRLHPAIMPPMNLQALMAGLDLEPLVLDAVARLIERKGAMREMGAGPRIARLDGLILEELAWARAAPKAAPSHKLEEDADHVFRAILKDPS